MTRAEDDDKYTPDEELANMAQQVNKSDVCISPLLLLSYGFVKFECLILCMCIKQGVDIDFSNFLCVFNYHPAVLDSRQFVKEPETTVDLLNRLAQGSLDDYNKKM